MPRTAALIDRAMQKFGAANTGFRTLDDRGHLLDDRAGGESNVAGARPELSRVAPPAVHGYE